MQTDIFDIADEAKPTPEPDIYECDNCGELFTPEQFADITANDLVVMWCEECEQSYLANEAWADKRACPECGNQNSGERVERLPVNGCPDCIQGELQPKHLPES